MKSEITFNFESHNVRTVIIGSEPWFIANDLCDVLNIKNSRKALTALDDTEKDVTSSYTPGGNQKHAIVSESGMWTLILRCRDAVIPGTNPYRVRKWITNEVLPSIRKTGSYGPSPEQIIKKQLKTIRALVVVNMFTGKRSMSIVADDERLVNFENERSIRAFIKDLDAKHYPAIAEEIFKYYRDYEQAYLRHRRRKANDMPACVQPL